MIDSYDRSERIAIKMDSHISESEAIRQTDAEFKPKPVNELKARVEALAQKQHQDKLKHMKPKLFVDKKTIAGGIDDF